MKDRTAALRYARALEGAVDGDDELIRAADELAAAARVIAGDRMVEVALESPALDTPRKKQLLGTLVKGAGLSGQTATLLGIMADHGHLPLVAEVAAAVAVLRDRRLGIVEAEVTTASPLSAEMMERTKLALEKKTGRKIRLSMKTDPSIIGGMVARIGSTVYDGSVRTRLAALRSHLVGH
jgi:F-type H+-transporting ATPase subunit delta